MPSTDYIQSVMRAVDILCRIARAGGDGCTLQQLARELELKPPTVHSFLRTLLARGWLERLEKPVRYRLGSALLELARGGGEDRFLGEVAGAMRRVAQAFPQATVTWSEASQREVAIRLRFSPERPGILEEPVNRVLHPYSSASPLLFQAFWSAEERSQYRAAHPFWECGGGDLWKSVERLDAFLRENREKGFVLLALPGEELVKVAVAVCAPDGHIRGGFGVSVPAALLPGEQHGRLVARATAEARHLAAGGR